MVPGFGRHLRTRTSATAGQDGVRTACARRREVLVVDLLDPCPWSMIAISEKQKLRIRCEHMWANVTR